MCTAQLALLSINEPKLSTTTKHNNNNKDNGRPTWIKRCFCLLLLICVCACACVWVNRFVMKWRFTLNQLNVIRILRICEPTLLCVIQKWIVWSYGLCARVCGCSRLAGAHQVACLWLIQHAYCIWVSVNNDDKIKSHLKNWDKM